MAYGSLGGEMISTGAWNVRDVGSNLALSKIFRILIIAHDIGFSDLDRIEL